MKELKGSLRSGDYLAKARALGVAELDYVLLRQAERNFGIQEPSVAALLDPANWRVSRPIIVVDARRNQLGNFSVTWAPWPRPGLEPDRQFDMRFLQKCEVEAGMRPAGYGRPIGELMYIREPQVSTKGMGGVRRQDSTASLSLLHGFVARYEELISQLRRRLDVRHFSSLSVIETPSGLVKLAVTD